MSRSQRFKEDPELKLLREAEQQLLLRQREYAAIPKRLAQEQRDRESTMPPLQEIGERRRLKEHYQLVSRGAVANIQRDQTRSLMLLILLLTATGSLVWWGLKLMQG